MINRIFFKIIWGEGEGGTSEPKSPDVENILSQGY